MHLGVLSVVQVVRGGRPEGDTSCPGRIRSTRVFSLHIVVELVEVGVANLFEVAG